ncbi:MAG TPA: DCC1-like thiol-disulfide oxidoreductase family protein [Opitutaceae bacterium]|jgi:predicted DCC family thiol-disulfide oxidoreductase YuxK
MNAPTPVLLFDGECGLCNRTVRLLMRWDPCGRLRYSPLQGFLGQAYLRAQGLATDELSTVVFVPDWEHPDQPNFKLKSAAVIAALRVCGGPAAALGWALWVIPRPVRDFAYKVVGQWRYKIFGPWRACPLPRPEWRARVLE